MKMRDIVLTQVFCDVTRMVHTLAAGYGNIPFTADRADGLGKTDQRAVAEVRNLTEHAFELSRPIDDWESAAREHGGILTNEGEWKWPEDGETQGSAQEYCEAFNIGPHQREVYEHWAVSDWLAARLEAKGEKITSDFAGLTIWSRTDVSVAVAADPLLQEIAKETSE